MSELQAFEGWAVVEVMGHRVLAGYCDHVRVAGTEMLRVVVPGRAEGDPGDPHILAAGSIFALHPCSEESARDRMHPERSIEAEVESIALLRGRSAGRYEPEPDDPDDWDDNDSETC